MAFSGSPSWASAHARSVGRTPPAPRMLVERLFEEPLRLLVLTAVEERIDLGVHLPRVDAERLAGLAAHADDRRSARPGHGPRAAPPDLGTKTSVPVGASDRLA